MADRRASPGVRSRLLLAVLVRSGRHVRWPAHRLIAEAGVTPSLGFASVVDLLQLGLVQRHPCDDGWIRLTASPAGRRLLVAESRERSLGG